MIGIITDIFDDDVAASNGRPPIKKKVAIIVDQLQPDESIAVEFTGELRRTLIRGFKVNDNVEVKYKKQAHKNKKGKAFNNKKATSIKRL